MVADKTSDSCNTYSPNLAIWTKLSFLSAVHEDSCAAGVEVSPKRFSLVETLLEALQEGIFQADIVRVCRVDDYVRFVCEPCDELAVVEGSFHSFNLGVARSCCGVERVDDSFVTREGLELESRVRFLKCSKNRT